MKRLIMTVLVIIAGLSVIVPDVQAQSASQVRKSKRQQNLATWKQDMERFKAKISDEHKINDLVDSISSIQAIAAVQNRNFVLQIDNITFPNGKPVFVTSTTNFIYVKGDKAVVQISPSNYFTGPNGVGGVTVDGNISNYEITTDKKGRMNLSYSISGIGISAQINVNYEPGRTYAQGSISPNFNSNTIWISGTLVPYDDAWLFEGTSL